MKISLYLKATEIRVLLILSCSEHTYRSTVWIGVKFTLDVQYKWMIATWLAVILDALLYANLKAITQVYSLRVCIADMMND